MKKIKLLGITYSLLIGISSCTIYQTHSVTGERVGKKVEVSKGNSYSSKNDYSIATAMKKGKIKKVGSVDVTYKSYIFFTTFKTVVTGE